MKLQYICNELKDENEIAIIKKYGYTAKRYTITLTSKIFIFLHAVTFFILHVKISVERIRLS